MDGIINCISIDAHWFQLLETEEGGWL
jgi:hypothetical protein